MEIPVTVLMPVFNGAKYIGEAINSVLAQTFTDFELIIVNDGSTDDTVRVVQSYNDPRIKLISQPNGGVSSALNNGLKVAKGKYIARFDADDVCMPDRLQKQFHFMETNPDYILIGSDVDYITEEGEYIFTYQNIGYSDAEIKERMALYCPFVHSSVFYIKSIVTELGGYEIKAHTFEDYFLWTKLISRGKVCNFKESLIKVRFNASSVTIDEKDHKTLFSTLKEKALQTGNITNEEGKAIWDSVTSVSREKKISSYHRMLGKKFLWNNYQPAKARKHLIQSIKLEPANKMSYLLFMFSLFPESMIRNIYEKRKAKEIGL